MKRFLFPLLGLILASPAPAEVSLPGILSDHMVLQRSGRTSLWGKADPGERVKATLGDCVGTAEAGADGRWRLWLDLSKIGPGPWKMIVDGKNRIVVEDVLVGEVWLASGQSNMEVTLSAAPDAKQEIASATCPDIRFFRLPAPPQSQPSEECSAKWVVASPDTAGNFPAVAYHFAKKLSHQCGLPVGIVQNACGGSPIEAWISSEALDSTPETKEDKIGNLGKLAEDLARREEALKAREQWLRDNPREDKGVAEDSFARGGGDAGSPVNLPSQEGPCGAVWFRKEISLPDSAAGTPLKIVWPEVEGLKTVYWNGRRIESGSGALFGGRKRAFTVIPADQVKAGANLLAVRVFNPYIPATIKGNARDFLLAGDREWPLGGEWLRKVEYSLPPPATPPPAVPGEVFVKGGASYLFNSRIFPLMPYTLKGVLWYQGETNVGKAGLYRTAFPLLIKDWRSRWELGDLPFYFCQLPNNGEKTGVPSGASAWAELREAQDAALELPNVKRAVLIDVGEAGDIHPRDKKDVGERLARIALARDYGVAIPYESPVFKQMRREGDTIRVSFAHAEGGLVAKPLGNEYLYRSATSEKRPLVRNSPGGELEGFEVCGADGKWFWADAHIESGEVIVRSARVSEPRGVRYAWADNPTCNLSNGAGLPAAPFRAESSEDDPLWTGETDLSKKENIPLVPSEYRVIDQCREGDYQFTLGADIVFHNGEFVAQWANSRVDENDEYSLVRGRRSADAKIWSEPEVIAPGFEGKGFHSHGVFHSADGQLRAYVAQINQFPRPAGSPPGGYAGLRTDVFLYDEAAKQWRSEGTFGERDGFWPLCKPLRLGNGNWIMAGAAGGEKSMVSAVAICDGKDFTKWRIVRLPYENGLEKGTSNEVWGETTMAAQGPDLLAITRNQNKNFGYRFLYAKSSDYGETWTPLKESNFPGGGGRPTLGTLQDGRHFLVANMGTRNTLILALTEPGSFQFTKIFRVLDHVAPAPLMPGKAKRPQWGYPSALEHDGKLYIVYSVSKEGTGMSIVELSLTK